jgi:hypothetical protein
MRGLFWMGIGGLAGAYVVPLLVYGPATLPMLLGSGNVASPAVRVVSMIGAVMGIAAVACLVWVKRCQRTH